MAQASFLERIDAELRAPLSRRPIMDLADLRAARQLYAQILGTQSKRERDGSDVTVDDQLVPVHKPAGEVLLRIFRPSSRRGKLPCLFWIQGGGFVLSSSDMDDDWCRSVARRHGCIVTSVGWRRAPEYPFPAPLEDCYSALVWLTQHGADQVIDASQLVVGGNSSGGGMAAGLALLVRDRGELELRHQLLVYPMLDDRSSTNSAHAVTHPRVWNRANNLIAWRHYLGVDAGAPSVSPYAAPARMQDLRGLPSASILTGDLDLFADENIGYAQRLMQAMVRTELHVYPGAVHGFDRFAPQASISQRFLSDCDAILSLHLDMPDRTGGSDSLSPGGSKAS
jgi:acetyl esterase/lipase